MNTTFFKIEHLGGETALKEKELLYDLAVLILQETGVLMQVKSHSLFCDTQYADKVEWFLNENEFDFKLIKTTPGKR